MRLKREVQTEDVRTRRRIRIHIYTRTETIESETIYFWVIAAIICDDKGILYTGKDRHILHADFGNQLLGQSIAQGNV